MSYKQEAAGSIPASPMETWRIAQVAERLSDEEEAAGSIPAPPIFRVRSSTKRILDRERILAVAEEESQLEHTSVGRPAEEQLAHQHAWLVSLDA